MSSSAEYLPNIDIIYTSAACDACDKYHVYVCPIHTCVYVHTGMGRAGFNLALLVTGEGATQPTGDGHGHNL